MTLHVRLVVPDREVWTGRADRVIAKTLDGDIGILTGHTPVLGILAPGSLVRILPEDEAGRRGWVPAAVGGGFLSVADDHGSILARQAILGTDVDVPATRQALNSTDEPDVAGYLQAQLTAAGQESTRP
jgi:F-type H+-transporting ATPase subunit epsilon